MYLSPFLHLNYSCDAALKRVKNLLINTGLHPIQTFDLRSADTVPHNSPLPKHGINDGDFQMVILLVYSEAEEPETLILYGNQAQTWLSLADNQGSQISPNLPDLIKKILVE